MFFHSFCWLYVQLWSHHPADHPVAPGAPDEKKPCLRYEHCQDPHHTGTAEDLRDLSRWKKGTMGKWRKTWVMKNWKPNPSCFSIENYYDRCDNKIKLYIYNVICVDYFDYIADMCSIDAECIDSLPHAQLRLFLNNLQDLQWFSATDPFLKPHCCWEIPSIAWICSSQNKHTVSFQPLEC